MKRRRAPHDGFLRSEADVDRAALAHLRELREAAEKRRRREAEDEAATRALYTDGEKR